MLLSTSLVAWRVDARRGQNSNEGPARRESEIIKLVREHFYNSKIAEKWAAKHEHFAKEARDEASFSLLAKRALADLATSHTGYYDKHDPEYYALLSIFSSIFKSPPVEPDSPGADLTPDNIVRVIFAGGPAEKAGLRRGDKIVTADGKPFHRIDSFRGRSGKSVALDVIRHAKADPIMIQLTPRRIDPKKEWLEAQIAGSRIIDRKGKKIGYVPMFSGSGEAFEETLRLTFNEKLRPADALVIDFRNGFGGCNPSFVNLFTREPPALRFVDRAGNEEVNDAQWRKPVVLLINRGSRSGKEAVAYALKKHNLATLVGERTAGAVVGGRLFKLGDDAIMYLAVSDVRVDGVRLEGVGVEPDVAVPDELPFADGRDPQLEKALDVAAEAR
jgi:carboxyl-terminal processing protease